MSNYNSLKTTINANVKQNGVQAITGQILNSVLNAMVTTLGTGYQFAGVATTATDPGSPDAKVFYIANGKGTYTNFGGVEVTEDDVVVLYWDSSWHKVSTGIASQEKLQGLSVDMESIKGDNISSVFEYRGYLDGGKVYPNNALILFVFPVAGDEMVIKKSRGNRFVVASFDDIPSSGMQGTDVYAPTGTITDGVEYIVRYTPTDGAKYIAIYAQSNLPVKPTDAELRESISVKSTMVSIPEINASLLSTMSELSDLKEDVYAREMMPVDFSSVVFQDGYLVNALTGVITFIGGNTKACEIPIPATSKHVVCRVMYTGSNYGVAFVNSNKEYISGYYKNGTSSEIKTLEVPDGAKYFRYGYNTNQFTTPSVAFDVLGNETKEEKNNPVYVSTDGDDENDGGKDSPFATFSHAIEKGYKKIFGYPGVYHETLDASNLDELSIVALPTTATRRVYDESRNRMARISFDNSVQMTGLEMDSTTGLYKMPLSMPNTSNWYKVFISHTLDPESPFSQSVSYNCILWEIGGDVTEHKKMKPVLSLAECQSTNASFFYDGTSLYVHPTSTLKDYFRLINEQLTGVSIRFTNINKLYLEGVDVLFAEEHCSFIDNCVEAIIKDCTFAFPAYGCGSRILNSNVDFWSCDAICARTDGFGINVTGLGAGGGGNASFYNCNGLACGDDGISHHNNTSGTIRGGKWMYNGKGGLAPAYGSRVDIYDVLSLGNKYGLYLLSSEDSRTDYKVLIVGSAFKNNTDKDILITQYTAYLVNSKYDTKIMGANANLIEV